MRGIFLLLCAACMSTNSLAGPEQHCKVPMAKIFISGGFKDPFAPSPSPIPIVFKKIGDNGAAVSSGVSLFTAVGPTQIGQNSRSGAALELLGCDNNTEPEEGQLSWQDNPLQLSIGNSSLQYHVGAVVGNWALFVGVAGICKGVALKLGYDKAGFPGSLILPTLFLIAPTTTSSVTLIRDGSPGQQAIGGVSIAVSLLATGSIGAVVHPKYFKGQWDVQEQEWVDLGKIKTGYVDRYGYLFETYGQGRQWYILVELLTSMAVGGLKSYQILQQNCEALLGIGAGVYDAYAISQIALRPSSNHHLQLCYSAIAAAQAVAVSTQAIAVQAASEEMQEKVRTVTESVIVVTEYLLMIKTLYDMGRRIQSWYERLYPKAAAVHCATHGSLATLRSPSIQSSNSHQSDLSQTEMAERLLLPVRELNTPTDRLSDHSIASIESMVADFEPQDDSSKSGLGFLEMIEDALEAYKESKDKHE
ncbi:MAG: hypothetical protein WCK49_08170 [Myxococcaceae bacterium]